MVALVAIAAFATTIARRAVAELAVVSEATVWDFADVTLGSSYTSDFKFEGDAKNVENIYANFDDVTYASTFKADALAFKGEYPVRNNSKKFAQNGTLHFKTSVAGKIIVKFTDTGSNASATAVKRYLVVNGEQTEYWTSRQNNGTEAPYAAQLNVTTDEIEVPAGDVTIAGSSAICVSYIAFTPTASSDPEPAGDVVYDFAAAAAAGENPANFNGGDATGQIFYIWENSGKTDSKRNDYKGYAWAEGSVLPEVCHVWRRSDRINGNMTAADADVKGLKCPNDREMVIDGLAAGSKVVIEYVAANEGDAIIWQSSTADEHKTIATIGTGNKAAITGTTTIASGAAINIVSTPGYFGFKVKKNMVITKITISEGTVPTDVVLPSAIAVAEGISNGTVSVSATEAFAGDEITVTATPADGYELDAIAVKDADGADVAVTSGKFTMPAKAVTVSATFKKLASLYIIGGPKDWKLDDMTEMTYNATTQAYEYEYAPTSVAYFAISDVATAESWDDFNANHRYAIGENDKEATLNEAIALQKVNGTIVLKPVKEGTTYKISIAKDLSTITISGEAAPEPTDDTYVVAGNNINLFGEAWNGTYEANKMTLNETSGLYEKTYTNVALTKGTIEYKIVKNGSAWYPADNQKCEIAADGTYNVVVTFDAVKLEATMVASGATGINSIAADEMKDATIYTISGQRVEKAQKGLYIINGKKVVIK